jgi:hypothetical protein
VGGAIVFAVSGRAVWRVALPARSDEVDPKEVNPMSKRWSLVGLATVVLVGCGPRREASVNLQIAAFSAELEPRLDQTLMEVTDLLATAEHVIHLEAARAIQARFEPLKETLLQMRTTLNQLPIAAERFAYVHGGGRADAVLDGLDGLFAAVFAASRVVVVTALDELDAALAREREVARLKKEVDLRRRWDEFNLVKAQSLEHLTALDKAMDVAQETLSRSARLGRKDRVFRARVAALKAAIETAKDVGGFGDLESGCGNGPMEPPDPERLRAAIPVAQEAERGLMRAIVRLYDDVPEMRSIKTSARERREW